MMKKIAKVFGITMLVAALAIPVFTWADGWGRVHHMMGYGGGGPGDLRDYGQTSGSLTDGQRGKLDKLHQKFYDETARLRNEIRTQSNDLENVLNASNPDIERAKALQKEISELRAKLDQAQTNFELEARKINPDARQGRGYGRSYGRHMGGYGGRYCWN